MKINNTFPFITAASAIALLFSSCNTINPNNFNRAKYYNFGHHEPAIASLYHKSPFTNRQSLLASHPSTVIKYQPPVSILQQPGSPVAASQKAGKRMEQKTIPGRIVKSVAANIVSEIKPAINASPDKIADNNVDKGGGTVSVLVLVIIALFIAPLAVYLHDDDFYTHFWLILILWLLGIGFGLGINSLAYLMFLAAVVWAILIVTGSAGSV